MSTVQRSFTFAPQPATTRGQGVHIGGDPKGANFLYTNGRAVVVRNLRTPEIASEYTQHTCNATVARYCPSGYYIASGDVQGNVRIWDTTQQEHILKTETRALSGRINDLDWDFESKRLVAVGEGKEKFGHAFLFDTASSVGEISGHAKVINSVSIRPGRPLRAVTGSDDMTVNFYHGVPFKFNKSISDHSRFVQCVRYSPNGDFFASASSDTKMFLYDGKTGDRVAEFGGEDSHKGTVFSLSWNPDSKQVLSASADMTAKVWDAATQKVLSTFKFADRPNPDHQQVGCLWQGEFLISLSLSGDINYLDPRSPAVPTRVVRGHNKGITSLAISDKTMFTGSYEGRVCSWTQDAGTATVVTGNCHTNQVLGLTENSGKIYSTGLDDSFRQLSVKDKTYENAFVAMGAVPKGLAVQKNLAALAAGDNVILVVDGVKTVHKQKFTPTATAIDPSCQTVAVGAEDGSVKLFTVSGSDLTLSATLEGNRGSITSISYSPSGDLVAVADSQRMIIVYDTKTNEIKISEWMFHNARVNTIQWSPDGQHAVSGSLDTNVEVWSVNEPLKHISIKNAHVESVTGAAFLDNSTIVSVAQDGFIKGWKLSY